MEDLRNQQYYEASDRDLAQVEEMGSKKKEITAEIKKVIIGQEKVIEEILIALFCRGHCLLVGVPGLAKTLLISTLAGIMDLNFNRVQFTPDLMPSDITGTDILEEDPATRKTYLPFHQGAHLHQHPAGGRDQPHAAQDPGGPAPGHAGVQGDGRRGHAPPGPSLLRPGHPEPDRAGRDLSPAGGPARPVHVQHRHRLSSLDGGDGDRGHHDLLVPAGLSTR